MQVKQMPKSRSDSSNTQVTPNPELEKRTRRRFPAEYKLRIIAEADACKHGELGGILRREKLYSNQLADWRREYAGTSTCLSLTSSHQALLKASWMRLKLYALTWS
jgi:hypothetical protein